MRRDYFTCVFLSYICVALLYVCFVPLYFTYNGVVLREFSVFVKAMSIIYTLLVLFALPIIAAIKKKFWMMLGSAFYGLLAYLPLWFMPSLLVSMSGSKANIGAVIVGYFWEAVYGMVNAPFAALSGLLGSNTAKGMSLMIMPFSIATYAIVKLFRFYRDAYNDQMLSTSAVVDSTVSGGDSDSRQVREVRVPEALGTVILAPTTSPTVAPTVAPATSPTASSTTSPAIETDSIPIASEPVEQTAIPSNEVNSDTIVLDAPVKPASPIDDDGVIHL